MAWPGGVVERAASLATVTTATVPAAGGATYRTPQMAPRTIAGQCYGQARVIGSPGYLRQSSSSQGQSYSTARVIGGSAYSGHGQSVSVVPGGGATYPVNGPSSWVSSANSTAYPANEPRIVASYQVSSPSPAPQLWSHERELEKPAGTKNKGSYTQLIYTEEQQSRLGVDELGRTLRADPPPRPPAAASSYAATTYAIQLQKQKPPKLTQEYATALLQAPRLLTSLCTQYFKTFDVNQTGFFEFPEVIALAREVHENLAVPWHHGEAEHLRDSVALFGKTRPDCLSYDEFCQWFPAILQGVLEGHGLQTPAEQGVAGDAADPGAAVGLAYDAGEPWQPTEAPDMGAQTAEVDAAEPQASPEGEYPDENGTIFLRVSSDQNQGACSEMEAHPTTRLWDVKERASADLGLPIVAVRLLLDGRVLDHDEAALCEYGITGPAAELEAIVAPLGAKRYTYYGEAAADGQGLHLTDIADLELIPDMTIDAQSERILPPGEVTPFTIGQTDNPSQTFDEIVDAIPVDMSMTAAEVFDNGNRDLVVVLMPLGSEPQS